MDLQLISNKVLPVICSVIAVYLFGLISDHYSKKIKNTFDKTPPDGVSEEAWNDALFISNNSHSPVRWLGFLERFFFFCAFSTGASQLVAGWLIFKLGSKWQTWNTIVKFPEKIDNIDQISFLAAKNRYGSNILQRWLFGTLANIFSGYAGFLILNLVPEIIQLTK